MSNRFVCNDNRIHFGSNSLTPYHEVEIAELVRVVVYALINIDQLTHSYLSSVCRSQYKVIYSNAGMVSILARESPPHRYHVLSFHHARLVFILFLSRLLDVLQLIHFESVRARIWRHVSPR